MPERNKIANRHFQKLLKLIPNSTHPKKTVPKKIPPIHHKRLLTPKLYLTSHNLFPAQKTFPKGFSLSQIFALELTFHFALDQQIF